MAATGAGLLFNLMHTLLVCAASREKHKEPVKYRQPKNNTREVIIYKDRLPAKRNNSLEEMYNRLPVLSESDKHGMLMEEVKKRDWSGGF